MAEVHLPPRWALASLLATSAGCLPFFGSKGEPPRTPLAIARFDTAASELGLPPRPRPLSEATRMLGDAIEALPDASSAHERAQQIDAHSRAMRGVAEEDSGHARACVELAVGALQEMKKPAGSKKERERALKAVHEAVGVDDGYRALAHALVLFTGGRPGLASGSELRALVARLCVENDDIARHTVAQALLAIAQALRQMHLDAGDLAHRAEGLTRAAPLDYSPALRDALDRAVAALHTHRFKTPVFTTLEADAHDAVERVTRDRPFELQRSAIQDALRLISDALLVAASSTTNSDR